MSSENEQFWQCRHDAQEIFLILLLLNFIILLLINISARNIFNIIITQYYYFIIN